LRHVTLTSVKKKNQRTIVSARLVFLGVYQLEKLSLNGDIGENMARIAEYGLSVDEDNERLLLGAWNVISGKVNTGEGFCYTVPEKSFWATYKF
jgi:hypothetical protein